jgi:hypothetical protein
MLTLTARTKLSPEEVIRKAEEFFSGGGYGLEMKDKTENSVYFEGGGGGVAVSVSVEGDRTSVDMETREWEFQVKEFAVAIQ